MGGEEEGAQEKGEHSQVLPVEVIGPDIDGYRVGDAE